MKTMCKQTLAFLLCALLLCGAIPFAASAAEILSGNCGKDGDNVAWTLDTETGVLTISGTGEMQTWVPLPWENRKDMIQSVTIENGVTSIAELAFYDCSILADITIPDSVKSIGKDAFGYCTSLLNVVIPDSVISIGKFAFCQCTNMTDVTLPDSVTSIEEYTFTHCTSLTEVMIPRNVTSIDSMAFYCCTSLTSIIVDERNPAYCSDTNGVLFNKNKTTLVQYPIGNPRTAYLIPNSVIQIGDNAFRRCHSLTTMTIPDNVTHIGNHAFENCINLAQVTIGSSVTGIGDDAFLNCSDLTVIAVDERNLTFSSDSSGVLFDKEKTTLILYPTGNPRDVYMVPDSVIKIDSYAFFSCTNLTKLMIGNHVTAIGGAAFGDCASLSWVHIPANVTDIYETAFWLSDNVYICSDTADCYAKTYAEANGIEFRVCSGHGNAEILSGPCGKNGENVTWTLDKETGVLTISGTGEMADYTFSDPSRAPWYAYRESITTVSIGSGVTRIGDYAFRECRSLTSVTIPDSVTCIGDHAFRECMKLASVAIPDSVTRIGSNAFELCDSLMRVTISDGVMSVGSFAFARCMNLMSVTIGNGVTSIGQGAFNCCTALKSVTIPGSVTEIGAGTFMSCSELLSVTIADGVTTIGNNAFERCSSLTSVAIPDSVTRIGSLAFNKCPELVYVHIPAGVADIDSDVFADCDSLQYICSDMADCAAKTYAEENGIEFRVCDGNHNQPAPQTQTLPQHPQSAPDVKAECDAGAFDVPVSLLAEKFEQASLVWQKYEFDLSLRIGEEKMQAVYLIRTVDEAGNVVQPKAGHKVKLYIPIPAGCSVEKCRIAHLLDDQGTSESFKLNPTGKAKPFTVSEDGRCFIIEVTSFSPFIVFEEPLPVTLNLRNTKKTLPYGEKRTLTADVGNLPDGAKIVWTADNERVTLTPSADGKTCVVSAQKNGKVTVTATVVDKDGKEIKQDGDTVSVSVSLNAKANFFHKLFYWLFRIPWPFG